jgi:UMF1 family MFS transporter
MDTSNTGSHLGENYRLREQRGWMFYDWANSAYATTVAAVFLGPTLTEMARQAACAQRGLGGEACGDADNLPLTFLGITLSYDSWFPYVLGLSILCKSSCCPSPARWPTDHGARRTCSRCSPT